MDNIGKKTELQMISMESRSREKVVRIGKKDAAGAENYTLFCQARVKYCAYA